MYQDSPERLVTMQSQLRSDSLERYEMIKENYSNFIGKSLLDIGCSDGFFMAKFLEDGGLEAVGIEPDERFNCGKTVRDISLVSGDFDVCFYLDLHYHNEINYFPWIMDHVKTLYVSPSGMGNNKRLEEDLFKEFRNFTYVGKTAYADRNIYRVKVDGLD